MRFPIAFSGVCGAAVHRRVVQQPAMCSSTAPVPSALHTPEPVPKPAPPTTPATPASTPTFCTYCASVLETKVPAGDERARLVCTRSDCGRVHYENPRAVCATVAVSADSRRVLLARRKIWPRVGYWGIPAGFLELNESTDGGAERECYEECYAQLKKPLVLIAIYSVLPAKQIQHVYRATLENEGDVRAGVESMETRMFEWKDIPWDELAFPTCEWALKHVKDTLGEETPRTQLRSKLIDGTFVDTPVSIP